MTTRCTVCWAPCAASGAAIRQQPGSWRSAQATASADLIEAVAGVCTDTRSGLVLVDELHNISLTSRTGTEVADTLEYFSEWIPATFTYAGIGIEHFTLLSATRGEQIAGRFTLIPSAPFPYSTEWKGLVATLESTLLLHRHQPGTLTGLTVTCTTEPAA